MTTSTRPERGAWRIYSSLFDDYLWHVPDDRAAVALMASGDIDDPIYTAAEVQRLKGLSKEALRAVHATKTAFPGSKVVDTRQLCDMTNPYPMEANNGRN